MVISLKSPNFSIISFFWISVIQGKVGGMKFIVFSFSYFPFSTYWLTKSFQSLIRFLTIYLRSLSLNACSSYFSIFFFIFTNTKPILDSYRCFVLILLLDRILIINFKFAMSAFLNFFSISYVNSISSSIDISSFTFSSIGFSGFVY